MVEDDHGVRAILSIFLEKAGFQVFEAADAAEAKSVWQDRIGLIDVVVSDVVLPDGSGTALVEEFQHERPDVKVILMSGGVPAPQADALSHPSSKFLPKPFAPAVLVEAINHGCR